MASARLQATFGSVDAWRKVPSTKVNGVLPPALQRADKLKAVVDAATEALDDDPIVSLEYVIEDEAQLDLDTGNITAAFIFPSLRVPPNRAHAAPRKCGSVS